ncbi:unnamed protein product [Callosobruchus maculatus]|uniref:Cathepsin propeptide inhibitor domain-containing protein n=1 Tax=Callosobruchus maculatus TaxID=64391 RepID=A0A653BF95_CALMS|nr:unnamed protein product [Callosobruchus maculatus]
MFYFKFVLTLAICVTIVSCFPADNSYGEWNSYKTDYNKQYATPDEEAKRQEIFNDNAAFIEAHNRRYANGQVGYRLAVNNLADLTNDEYRRTRLGLLG